MRIAGLAGLMLMCLAAAASLQAQSTNETVRAETPAFQPLNQLAVGDKTFEGVTLTGCNGQVVSFSHAFGVKDVALGDLSAAQIQALNGTTDKIQIPVPPTPPPAATNLVVDTPAAAAGQTNAIEQAAPLTNAPPAAVPPPPEDPAVIASAAASTEAMIQDFKSLGRTGAEVDHGESESLVKVPGFVRVLAWAGFFMLFIGEAWLIGLAIHETDSMTWALLIFFFNPISGLVYCIFHIRSAALPYGLYAAGLMMLMIPILHYRMGFFELLM